MRERLHWAAFTQTQEARTSANHKRAPVVNFITKAVTVRKPSCGDVFTDFV